MLITYGVQLTQRSEFVISLYQKFSTKLINSSSWIPLSSFDR